ncbi:hypothetical protein ACFUNF_26950 [Streptomyces sp. NPDC057291]|uniref:hypothetical protein n=1 Tax=Streptomyces sp. NPDC057291 TaxID=3346087 RepID=UPI00362737D8
MSSLNRIAPRADLLLSNPISCSSITVQQSLHCRDCIHIVGVCQIHLMHGVQPSFLEPLLMRHDALIMHLPLCCARRRLCADLRSPRSRKTADTRPGQPSHSGEYRRYPLIHGRRMPYKQEEADRIRSAP